MNNINLFESSSSFESAFGGGTLAYPNTSLIEETQSLVIIQTPQPQEITFYIYGNEHKAIPGMTWGEWCRYGIGVHVDGQYDAYYSIYPGYNDGSDDIDGFYPGCDCTWICTGNGEISTDTFNGTWCISCGRAYIIDAKCDDIIEKGRDYNVDTSELHGGGSWGV